VRAVADRHGGHVSVAGSRFTIELPALAEHRDGAPQTTIERHGA
jgi:signal transduction histidine kinase